MLLRIEKGSSVPVSRQIAEQVASLCAAGSLRPGDRVPSVRELARELAVNQNTVLRVYERLTAEGLLERRHGQGTFVSPKANQRAAASHRKRLVGELRQLCRQGRGLGLTGDEIHELVTEALGQLEAESPTPQEAAP
ncbi:HTH-type transcriptional repressor YtrA [Pseudobythopirellula maris]|uniref:HTH-type transcriptional repressor YtrA n=1 Tax=Pseudobythopirellula maris TaxID=2527991 RepID=A0A5C5ZJK7_9BACT|nr:GntR family transcriptional regulator [Pseudobythopirellula maris]TWT87217.1 HTH-type transcriptional repressor YtrA [Pseudobythopirellula maris]